jgi:cyanophycin synthetase
MLELSRAIITPVGFLAFRQSPTKKRNMTSTEIKVLRITHLRGPNIWTYRPALEAWVDIGALEDSPSNTIPGFYERLDSALPGLIEHRCGVYEKGGFMQRVREGTWPVHILEHIVIELQNLAGMQTGFGQTRGTPERGVYKMAVRARDENVCRAAIEHGRDLLQALIDNQTFDVKAAIADLTDLVEKYCLGPSTACIVNVATARRIPSLRLNEGNLVQLGHGKRQRRIWTAETDQTSAIAEGISSDKDLTKMLLNSVGVPVPEGVVVKSPGEAWEAAEDIGLPVVVKPTDGNHGRGISIELTTREEVEAAYPFALRHGSDVMVEKFIPGNEHRLLVVAGKVVAASRGESAWVTGNGVDTVYDLVEAQINSDPRRGTTEEFPLNEVGIVDDTSIRQDLSRQGLEPDSVPENGRSVLIQRNGNVAFECTELVHPEVAAAVGLAARVVGLDIAGIDVVAEDISRPLKEQGGAVVEVNAGPGLLMHLKPASGTPQPVGEAITRHLFGETGDGRIPIVGVSGRQHTTQVARLVHWFLDFSGRHTGLACADGLYLGKRKVDSRKSTSFDAGQRLLINRSIGAAVFETDAISILREGLPYDRCAVGIVMDVTGADELAEFYMHDADHVFKVLRTQIDVVLSDGVAVLNAADEQAVEMAELCDGDVIFFGSSEDDPLAAHQDSGGRVVFMRDGEVVLATGRDTELQLAIGVGLQRAEWPPEPILASIAAAWALKISPELISAGMDTFSANLHKKSL